MISTDGWPSVKIMCQGKASCGVSLNGYFSVGSTLMSWTYPTVKQDRNAVVHVNNDGRHHQDRDIDRGCCVL